MTRVMNEVICFGGIPLRRCDAYSIACESDPEWRAGDPASGMFGPDYQAFAPEAINAEPYTLEEARDLFFNDNMKIPERLHA